MGDVDWSLFELQEKNISTINNELYALRKQKYPEYRDSYYRYYNEFGMRGMIGDLYRKFDRLKIMSESYTDSEIVNKEKEITDQFYDIISYCQLQLYWLRREKWGKRDVNPIMECDSSQDIKNVGYSYPKLHVNGIFSPGTLFYPVIDRCVHVTINVDCTRIREVDVEKLVKLIRDLLE